MEAHQLLKAGRLTEAIDALQRHLANEPGDYHSQTFLYELICFTGNFNRAKEQLESLVRDDDPQSEIGIARYRDVLRAERTRQKCFAEGKNPRPSVDGGRTGFTGTLNGREFVTFSDVDPRIGENLEIFASGKYLWIPLSDMSGLRLPAPRRLRDLLWLPAELTMVPSIGLDLLQETWVPMMAPLTWQHPDEEVKLGRFSEWKEDQTGQVRPYGVKTYLVDGIEVPLAEIRELTIRPLVPGSTIV